MSNGHINPNKLGRVLFWALILGAFFVAAWISTRPVWPQPGMWPVNHEGGAFFLRVDTMVVHFRAGDFFPIWAADDNLGFGSFQPALYHKLFYFVAAFVYLLVGDAKSTIILTISLFAAMGAMGVTLSVRNLAPKLANLDLISVIAGATFIFANYNYINWLVRGAVAEFSGAMCIPLLIFFFIKSVQTKTINSGFVIMLGLIFWSHSVLAYYAGLICALAWIVTSFSLKNIFENFWHYVRLTVLLTIMVGFPLLIMSRVGGDYDLSRILAPPYQPQLQYKLLLLFFFDPNWPGFLKAPGLYTVQLSIFVTLACTTQLIFWTIRKIRSGTEIVIEKPFFALVIVLACCWFLQFKYSAFFYIHVPGADYLQMPWRLLSIIVPLFYILAFSGLHHIFTSNAKRLGLAAAISVLVIFNSAVLGTLSYSSFEVEKWADSRNQVETDLPIYAQADGTPGLFNYSAAKEYVPVKYKPKIKDVWEVYNGSIRSRDCAVKTIPGENRLITFYEIECLQPQSAMPLPFFSTQFHRILDEAGADVQFCTPDPDTHFCTVNIINKKTRLRVKIPTLGAVLF